MMASQKLPPADNTPPKIKSSNNSGGGGGTAMSMRPPAEQGIKCPRCDSANTKFCYYNNYSLSQPRHFCKTCRRYWTKGGALRNVPVGGGCRKSKSSPSTGGAGGRGSSSSCSISSSGHATNLSSLSSSSMGNFQLGMLPSGLFNASNQYVGFNYPVAAAASPVGSLNHMGSASADDQMMFGYGGGGGGGGGQQSSSIALSIESLSSMNQDLHWKLQQQRLAMLFGGGDQSQSKATTATPLLENHHHHHHHHHHQMVEPISFQVADQEANGDICGPRKTDAAAGAGGAAAWFLGGSSPANYSNGRMINGGSNNNNTGDWNGITAWSDMPQFSALP